MLARVKRFIWREHLIPFLGRRSWRPAACTPLGPDFLRAVNGFDEEDLIKAAARTVAAHTMASLERLATLWQQVRYLDRYGIGGALVECGVWRGGCAGMMALAHLHAGGPATREIHLFDSFQGLPQPDRRFDGMEAVAMAAGRADGVAAPIGACVASAEDSRQLLVDLIGYPSHLVKTHAGWFEDTLPLAAPAVGPVALLRLDGDWYRSTKICLEHLYDQVSAHGVVVIDDYGHFRGCRKAVDEFVEKLGIPILMNHIDYTGRFWVRS
ncbi:MAG TPA: TylF/MycF/NovP-related O-methyltransferase, partial [Candidatus Sulfopaludibacter sp.]|nr:TylF/MycF/NovP-related O-methyltransferase [Candidatus Sulfopaludibacter sp.]